ncbi:hypothetical protein O23A_P4p0059 (plasmid) [Aeromonas salmonicida]|nr:hypothetical protein O23A_P4p0059 [Aeromonas salmonicida]
MFLGKLSTFLHCAESFMDSGQHVLLSNGVKITPGTKIRCLCAATEADGKSN